ncbi:MAG: dihydropteroate synthase [Chloroflexi bacterium]|nr:dihydropteroate synthase [Chloroflexota bacterium]
MPAAPPPIEIGGHRFEWGRRTYVMGIVNVTPDSFSGDGVLDPARAADQAARMVAEGADIIDVGAESTRPGHAPLSVDDEWSRLEAPLRAVRAAVAVPITVDTSKAGVAERAFDAGADALNDVRGLLGDAELAGLLARRGLPAVVMHNQRDRVFGGDVIADIRAGLRESIDAAVTAGVDAQQLIVDPGFGFGWEPVQNLEMVRRLGELRDLGRPLLVGVSRKSTLGLVLDKPEAERAWGTAAAVALAVQGGADIVRVHDVAEMADVVRIADAVVRPGSAP